MNPSDVTTLLDDWRRGDRDALERLLPLVYSELRRIAARQLKKERAGHTLQPTALVHEAYLRLADQRQVDWKNQAHFFGVAAQVMRRVLVDHARRRAAAKRGDGAELVSIEQASDIASTDLPVLALDAALDRLEKIDPGLAKLVELRAFSGLNNEQAALILDISPSTVKRELRTAKAWLTNELGYGRAR
jgi:RNA polymerase sigma factor (TIGR02999 family)